MVCAECDNPTPTYGDYDYLCAQCRDREAGLHRCKECGDKFSIAEGEYCKLCIKMQRCEHCNVRYHPPIPTKDGYRFKGLCFDCKRMGVEATWDHYTHGTVWGTEEECYVCERHRRSSNDDDYISSGSYY